MLSLYCKWVCLVEICPTKSIEWSTAKIHVLSMHTRVSRRHENFKHYVQVTIQQELFQHQHSGRFKLGGVVCVLYSFSLSMVLSHWVFLKRFYWGNMKHITNLEWLWRPRGSVINQVVIDPYHAQTVRPISYPSGPFANDLGEWEFTFIYTWCLSFSIYI